MTVRFNDGEAPLDEAGVAEAERALGVRLPDDYRRFLLTHNGGQPEPDGFDIRWRPGQSAAAAGASSMVSWLFMVYGGRHESLVRMNTVTFKGRLPAGTIAIGRDPGSNLLLLRCDDSPQRGEVGYWVMEFEAAGDNVGFVAPSFDAFVAGLH